MNGLAIGFLMALLRTTVSLLVAALVVEFVLRWVRPVSPRIHRVVWLLVLVQGWFWWQLPLRIPYAAPTHPQAVAAEMAEAKPVADEPLAVPELPKETVGAALPSSTPSRALRVDVTNLLLGTWVVGMLGLAGAGLWGYFRFLGQLFATGSAEPEWTQQWDELCDRQGVRNVPLRVSAHVGPLLCLTPWGYRLVIPAPLWQRLGPAERLSILRHELAHLERGDLLKSMLVRLLILPHWFNPLAWLAARRFDEAAEWACDEAARGPRGQEGASYAQALLQLDAVFGQSPSYRAAAWGRGLSSRISRLLNPRVEEDSLMKRLAIEGAALGLVVVCLFRVSLVAQEPPQKATPVVEAPEAAEAVVSDFRSMPQDAKLTDRQRAYRDWDAQQFGVPDAAKWQELTTPERAEAEQKYLKQLSNKDEKQRVEAIDALVGLGCKVAVPDILKIAAEQREKNNWDRHTATRALGMLGDLGVVPDLVALTYHYNWNVRQWAQISLVRLTGENFGPDIAAWARWWSEQGHTPPISEQRVAWAMRPETLKYADPKWQEEHDRQMPPAPTKRMSASSPQVQAAHQRMRQDQSRFSQEALAEMESLMRIADQQFGSAAAWDAMKTLVEKYLDANRTGCSLVYLGQMNKDGRQLAYFQQAIDKHSDCYYGDGVQVGAFARFQLGQAYWKNGRKEEARKLFEELRRDFPQAVGHNGRLLVEQLPKE